MRSTFLKHNEKMNYYGCSLNVLTLVLQKECLFVSELFFVYFIQNTNFSFNIIKKYMK